MEIYNVTVVNKGREEGDTACFLVESKGRQFEITNCHLFEDPFMAGHRINTYLGSYSYEKDKLTFYCETFLFLDERIQEGVLILGKNA